MAVMFATTATMPMMTFKRAAGNSSPQSRVRSRVRNAALIFLVTLALQLPSIVMPSEFANAQKAVGGSVLQLSVVPSTLPANGNTYSALFVQLLGPNGAPRVSQEPTRVFLSSSNPSVATVLSEVTIEPGASYVNAPITLSAIPGVTQFIALASGRLSGETQLETFSAVGAVPPFRIVVSALPPLSYTGAEGILTVSIVGANDVPYIVPDGVTVILTSASPERVWVPDWVIIPPGSTLAKTIWLAREPGQAHILAQANGLEANSFQVDVFELLDDAKPVGLEAYSLAPSLLARDAEDETIVMQALTEDRRPVPFPCSDIFVTSSAPNVARGTSLSASPCDSPLPYVSLNVLTTNTPGQANLTIGTSGLDSSVVPLTTYRLGEARLALEIGPQNPSTADDVPTTAYIQLVDVDGRPVAFHNDYTITILSEGVHLPQSIVLPNGRSFVSMPIRRDAISAGNASISVTTPGVQGASLSFAAARGSLDLTIRTSDLVAGASALAFATVLSEDGIPVANAEVTWEAEGILPAPMVTHTDEEGIAQLSLQPRRVIGSISLSARASHPNYEPAEATSSFSLASLANEPERISRTPFVIIFGLLLLLLVSYLVYQSGIYKKRLPLTSKRFGVIR